MIATRRYVHPARAVSFLHLRIVSKGAYTTIGDEDLRQRATMTGRLPSHGLNGVDGRAGGTRGDREQGCQPWRVEGICVSLRRHRRVRRRGWMLNCKGKLEVCPLF